MPPSGEAAPAGGQEPRLDGRGLSAGAAVPALQTWLCAVLLDSMLTPSEEPVALSVMLMVWRGESGESSAALLAAGRRMGLQQGAGTWTSPPGAVVMAMLSCVCGIDSCRRVVIVSAAAGPAVAGRSGLLGGSSAARAARGEAAAVAGTVCAVQLGGPAARRWCTSSSCWAAVLNSAGKQR
jgi:hypothetical protein